MRTVKRPYLCFADVERSSCYCRWRWIRSTFRVHGYGASGTKHSIAEDGRTVLAWWWRPRLGLWIKQCVEFQSGLHIVLNNAVSSQHCSTSTCPAISKMSEELQAIVIDCWVCNRMCMLEFRCNWANCIFIFRSNHKRQMRLDTWQPA